MRPIFQVSGSDMVPNASVQTVTLTDALCWLHECDTSRPRFFHTPALLTLSSAEFTLGTAAVNVLMSEIQMFRNLFILRQPVLIYEPDCSPYLSQLIANVAIVLEHVE